MRDVSFARPLRVHPWFLLLLAILPGIAFALHFQGHMVLGWDSEPPLRPDLFLRESFSAWNWRAYLGQPNVFQISQAPLALVYYLLAFAFPVEAADKIVLTALFVLPAFTMYYCARRLFPRDPWLPFAAAWCYALCPLLFVRFYVPIMTVQLDYVLLPLLANVWIDIARHGASAKRLLWLAGVEVLFWPCGNNLAYWLVPHATAAGLVVLAVIKDPAHPWRSYRASIGRALTVTLLINLFWIVPVVLFGLLAGSTVEHESITKAYTTGVRQDVAAGSGLSYTVRMSSRIQTGAGDLYGPYWTYARSLENGLVVAPYYAWILLVSLALALRWRDRRVVVLGVLLCFALFVMKGESPPFEFVLQAFYKIPLLGTIFRNGNDKLLPMAAFALALLVPVGVSALGRKTRFVGVWQFALLAVVLAMAFPYWTGQMFMARSQGPSLSSMPSPDAFAFARSLDGLPSRVLFVPVSENPQLLATQWGFYGPNVYGSMTDADFIANPASTLNRPGADLVTTALYDAVRNGDVTSFVALTRATATGYVFVAHDIDPFYYGGTQASVIDSFLGSVPGTSVATVVGPYTLWRLSWVPGEERELIRERYAGYDTDFPTALTLASRCGREPLGLIALATDAACTIESVTKPADQEAPGPVVLHPVRAVVARGRLLLTRGDAAGASAALALPPQTAAVRIAGQVVAHFPVALSLLPCARYAVDTYVQTQASTEIATSFSFPAPDGAYVPLPAMDSGVKLLRLDTSSNGPGASVWLSDAVTAEPVLDAGKLRAAGTDLLFTSMPGRAYELALGTQGPFLPPRSFIRSLSVASVTPAAVAAVVAPPENAPVCAPEPPPAPSAAYLVRNPVVRTTLAVTPRGLLVAPHGETPRSPQLLALPRGTSFVRVGPDFAGTIGYDVALPTGAARPVQFYRQTGSTRPVSLQTMSGETDLSVSNADLAGGSAAIRSINPGEQWMRILLGDGCGPTCVVTVRASSIAGLFGAAVVDHASSSIIAAEKGVRKPEISIAYHARAGVPTDLYVYTETDPKVHTDTPGSAVQIASIAQTPVDSIGSASIAFPRVVPSLPTNPAAVVVTPAASPATIPFDGRSVVATASPTVLVLDTQFDPFWTTLVLPSGGAPIFPKHVEVDGYKNGWIVPPGVSGGLVRFYLLDVLAVAGLVIAALTVLVLAAGTLRPRRAAIRVAESRAT